MTYKWHTAHVTIKVQVIRNTAHRPSTQASYTIGSGTTMQENQPHGLVVVSDASTRPLPQSPIRSVELGHTSPTPYSGIIVISAGLRAPEKLSCQLSTEFDECICHRLDILFSVLYVCMVDCMGSYNILGWRDRPTHSPLEFEQTRLATQVSKRWFQMFQVCRAFCILVCERIMHVKNSSRPLTEAKRHRSRPADSALFAGSRPDAGTANQMRLTDGS